MEEVIIYMKELIEYREELYPTIYKKNILWDKADFNIIRNFMDERPECIIYKITDLNNNIIWKP